MSRIATRASLPTRRIGSTAITVSELGFGAATLGNLYQPVRDDEAQAAISKALDAGITYIDTAPHYGRGLSERRVGDALRGRAGVTISSKVGRLLRPWRGGDDTAMRDGFVSPMPFRAQYDYSHDAILRSCEDSLQRLGLAHIDIVYVHDIGALTHGVNDGRHWQALTAGGGFRALARLREEGMIGAFGVGVNEVAVCERAMAETRLDVILLAGRYTLLDQSALDGLLPACLAQQTSIVIGGPYNSGILATGTRGGGAMHYDYAPASAAMIARVAAIETIAQDFGVTLPAAALAFVLAHPAVASVIPGMGSARRVTQTLALHAAPIPTQFWTALREAGLIRPDAPVPGETR